MSTIEKMQSGMFDNGLGDAESEHQIKQKAAQKKRDKFVEAVLKNEDQHKTHRELSNRFDAQMITIASPMWGDIILTKDFFLFVSFGLDPPKDKYVYLK